MKIIYSINSLLKILFFVLFLFSITVNAQSILDKYEGIPIETSLDWWNIQDIPLSVDSMDSAGIDIVHISFDDQNKLTAYFDKNYNMDLLPITTPKPTTGVYNWIQFYTDAKYSVWEAEGTQFNPTAKGNATLYRNMDKTEIINNQYIRLKDSVAGSPCLMSWGPYYLQDVEYETYENGVSGNIKVQYTADFSLKLECIGQDTAAPTDTLCILQVTQSTWQLECSDTVAEIAVTRADFANLNTFIPIKIENYKLENFDCPRSTNNILPPQNHYFSTDYLLDGVAPGPRWIRERIEFKVIWKGNSNYNLSYDKVILSDSRGSTLKDPSSYAITNLTNQLDDFSSHQNSVFGWLGIDEPQSIDQYEPIRVVDSLIRAKTQNQSALVVPIMGCYWVGTFSHPADAGSMALNKYEEMKLRIGDFNIIQNAYMFDTPCNYDNDTLDKCDDGDIRAINIYNAANDIYKHAYDNFPNFGASLQCGAVYNEQANQRNVARHEVLYSANLALMYGAKFLQLWRYFPAGPIDDTTGTTTHGIVDWTRNGDIITPIYSDKYSMLKDTLSPRMKGLMGKTLKQLAPTEKVLGLNASTNYNLAFNRIERVKLANYYGTEALNSYIDIGTFNKPGEIDDNYFLVINRWYSDAPHNKFYIQFRNLCDFRNWNLINYVDTTSVTLVSDINGVVPPSPVDTIVIGDAILYSIKPVAEFGGKLITNESVLGGTTLTEDMSIESGTTLYVTGVYNSNANITVKTGGKIICSSNGKIVFGSGKKLTLEGTAQLLGNSSADKLKLEFSNVTNGIEIQPNASVTINYCEITGANTGIANQSGNPSVVNISNTKITAGYSGISLTGVSGYELNSTPTIENCEITSTISGINVSNYGEFLVLNNRLNNCGIYFSNVPASYIQGNNINGGTNQSILGVFMNNSGGFIRKDTITNCLNAIQLANSSPDIGGCWIYNNKRHGIYIGSGSIPNLVGYYTTNPPTYFALSGYNKIDANGLQTGSTPADNDGSEIYLSSANILLNNGCNQISDDRVATPSMNTQYLISGSLNTGSRTLSAIYNYWGTTIPASSRYKNLSVVFSPYYATACNLGSGGSSESLVLRTSKGALVDSISSAEGEPASYTTLQENYSIADNLFATGNVIQAKPLYEQIVNGNHTAEEKLSAYNKLYTIGNLTGADENYFTSLQTTFEDIANNEADTLIKKVYSQNAIKCDVSKEEYLTAISKFDNIIQQNPNSEEAVYAEIDIITTALNLDTTNSQLGKMGNGKYLVKGTSDYLSKLNDILQSKFGVNSEEKEQMIPKEYSLYHNYPNPFNPVTTIKFDIPNDGLITLEIFDILGRRIATLINDFKPAGRYEQVFNASSIASGVYVYKLQAGDFVSSKKMILLK